MEAGQVVFGRNDNAVGFICADTATYLEVYSACYDIHAAYFLLSLRLKSCTQQVNPWGKSRKASASAI